MGVKFDVSCYIRMNRFINLDVLTQFQLLSCNSYIGRRSNASDNPTIYSLGKKTESSILKFFFEILQKYRNKFSLCSKK